MVLEMQKDKRFKKSRSESKKSKNSKKQKSWRKEEKNLHGRYQIEALHDERE